MNRLTTLIGLYALCACGTSLPARYVIEDDLGGYTFRRYQNTLEGELPIPGNAARGHSAAYMRQGERSVEVVTALVTVHERAARLTESMRAELAALPGYELETGTLAGQYAWQLRSESEPSYWIWPSGRYVVKLATPAGQQLPEAVARPYAGLYPSDLDEHGHALPGATSGGSAQDDTEEAAEPSSSAPNKAETPSSLAEPGQPR